MAMTLLMYVLRKCVMSKKACFRGKIDECAVEIQTDRNGSKCVTLALFVFLISNIALTDV